MKTSKGRIIDYYICSSAFAETLSKLVKTKLDTGWEVRGKLKFKDGNYLQLVVKREVVK